MNANTLLFRQIHPDFVRDGRVTTQAFTPVRPRTELPAYNGDQISPKASWVHYTGKLALKSDGVLALTVGECRGEGLETSPDPRPNFKEHVIITFAMTGTRRIPKRLRDMAVRRGWQYQP